MDYAADILIPDIRLVILRALAEDLNYSHNDSIIHAIVKKFGHNVARDVIRTQLHWLKEQCLVTIEMVSDTYVATITQRGVDVASGSATVPGVKRPGPKG